MPHRRAHKNGVRIATIVALLAVSFVVSACTGSTGSSPTPSHPASKNIASIAVRTGGTITPGTPTTLTLTIVASDASGHTLSGTYREAISLSDNDTTGSTTLSTSLVTSSSQTVTLSYNGSGAFKGATIIASATGATSGTLAINSGACNAITVGGGPLQGYYPCMLQSAYNLDTAAGTGQTIAVVDAYDDPNAEADLGVYRSTFGLAACTTANGCFKKVAQDGSTNYPTADTGWAGEESLDLDMASAVCPNCHIILVEANSSGNGDLYTAEDEAATLGATEISNSWSGAEYNGETTADVYFNHPGIPITVAAGDNGYSDNTGAASPQYPTASKYVTAVGGTSLSPAANTRGWTEVVWNDMAAGNGATGSGCSIYEPKPAWQTDTGCTTRVYNDVSANGDPQTGVAVYDTYNSGGWGVVGGTSEATPIVAGMYALAGNGATINNGSYPYLNPGHLNDVTSGDDITGDPSGAVSCPVGQGYVCTAGVGYDGPTGLGTPDGTGGMKSLMVRRPTLAAVRAVMVPRGLPQRRLCALPARGHMACDAIVVVGAH
ncbi:MAG TPA: S53 family peptidase [Candidatus Dormibacteraeota bacterium]|nr:S53 family peptidase [Candidatus Dormibacteraeota bacterium]